MRVARNCRRRRSPAVSNSSPTSFTLPPVGISAFFCNRPITVSAVTDLPEPLSPTRHSVSRSESSSETSSMMRRPLGFLPRLTTRLLMVRTGEVMSVSLRRHCERSEAIHSSFVRRDGLLRRFAPRNDELMLSSLPRLALLHAGIERVARGIADQIDTEDRDREQQAGPENQRRLDQEV